MLYLPVSLFIFISFLLHNFIIFPPQCFYSLLHNFYYFPSSMFFIPLLHLHLLIYSIYFSIHKYIDLLATLHRPHIDPTSIPHRPHIDPTSTLPWWWRESLHGSSTVKTSLGYETKGVIYLFCNISSAIKRLDFFSFRIYGGELNWKTKSEGKAKIIRGILLSREYDVPKKAIGVY